MPPTRSEVNFRCASYFIAESVRSCWRCGRDTRVFGFLLPHRHLMLLDNDDGPPEWESQESAAILYYITELPGNAQARIRALTRHYHRDFSKTIQSVYWMNHCERCGMKQGDFDLFEEFDTPFCPIDPEDAARILLRPIGEVFEASATSSEYEPEFFERMTILPYTP